MDQREIAADTSAVEAVFLDMDDVLVSLSDSIALKLGVDISGSHGKKFDFTDIYKANSIEFFSSLDHGWWASLPRTGWASAVVDSALSLVGGSWDKIHILTSLPYECDSGSCSSCVRGKMAWLRWHCPEVKNKNIVFAYNKWLNSGPRRIIFDDMERNADSFPMGVLIPSRWNRLHHDYSSLVENPASYLAKAVGRAVNVAEQI
jgi:hypothetical protein